MEKFKSKTRLFKVYHIRMKDCHDTVEGYVGITRRSLQYRLGQHYHSQRPVGEILRSLDKQQVEIVELGRYSKEEALDKEFELRPRRNIGWNVMAGGNRATVVCPGCGKHLPKRRSGSYCEECQDGKFKKGFKPYNYGRGERYTLIDPEGNEYIPEAFTVFCRERNLNPQNLRQVAKGKRHHHKGWRAIAL